MHPDPAKRLDAVVGNVWDWVASSSLASPIQPIANLGLGLMEFNPPQFLIDAHKNALDRPECNQYGPPGGLPRFTQALSETYSPIYGRSIDPSQEISVHTGGSEAILSAIVAFIEAGDEVIVIEPAFNLYELHIKFVGGVVKYVPLHPPSTECVSTMLANDWTLDLLELESSITPKSKMLILNNPHNPLGKVFSAEEVLSIGKICVKYGLLILSDEVYEHLHYEPAFARTAVSEPAIGQLTLTVGSVGKAFNATGWRVGFLIGDKRLVKHVQNAHIILSYTTPGPPQEAAAVGLREAERRGFWDMNRREMKGKLDSICELLDELGLPYVKPSGAYFIFINTQRIRVPATFLFPPGVAEKPWDWKLCWFLIQEVGVCTIPGSAFYCPEHAEMARDYLRLVACKTDKEIEYAKEKLRGLRAFL